MSLDADLSRWLERRFRRVQRFVTTRLQLRARLLFVLPVPLLFSGIYATFQAEPILVAGRFGGLALLWLAAWLLLQGQRAQFSYEERDIARAPALPRKLMASLLTGAGVLVTGLFGTDPILNDPMTTASYALLASVCHSLAFGLDPWRPKGLEGFSGKEAARLLSALEEGERLITETRIAAQQFPDPGLRRHVDHLLREARHVFSAIERDPRDLQRSRKFMHVYLQGARDATVKAAELNQRDPAAVNFNDYSQLLQDLQDQFVRQRQHLLTQDKSNLEVEVEVLRDRLRQEQL